MQAIADSGVAEIAVLCDSAPDSITQGQGAAPDAAVVASFDALLDAGLDGVVIATPSALHAAQA
ncbi:MAG: gfo/Idh/MocA family oxidoreductase, partial [Comamonadaceae bacterium]